MKNDAVHMDIKSGGCVLLLHFCLWILAKDVICILSVQFSRSGCLNVSTTVRRLQCLNSWIIFIRIDFMGNYCTIHSKVISIFVMFKIHNWYMIVSHLFSDTMITLVFSFLCTWSRVVSETHACFHSRFCTSLLSSPEVERQQLAWPWSHFTLFTITILLYC